METSLLRTSDALWNREQIQTHIVRATPDTVQWGGFDASVEPVARVRSGAIVFIECLARTRRVDGDVLRAHQGGIQNSDLSEPLRSAVLSSMTFNDYYGMGSIVINVPSQSRVATVGERVFTRRGDSTIEVTGTALIDVASRF
jgi:hypothetical protein